MKKAFHQYDVVIGYKQPKSLRNVLIRSRFPCSQPILNNNERVGLFHCTRSCTYHTKGYFIECRSFRFGKFRQFEWIYTRYFDCNSKNVIYVLKCYYCWEFYIGETGDLKKRTVKHKSDILHPHNSNCKKLSFHLHQHANLGEPFFQIYPIYYVDDTQRRRFIEKRFIHKYHPTLNGDM